MSEAEAVITIEVEELTTDLYALAKKPPCFLLLDGTPMLFHTLYNLYHCGIKRFTFVAPLRLKEEVESFIQTAQTLKIACKNTDLNFAEFQSSYYEKNSALQEICNMVRNGKINSQNLLIIQSSCYFDSPLSQIMDVHRRTDATVTVIHPSKMYADQKSPKKQGCMQIAEPVTLNYNASEMNYTIGDMSFFANLDERKLSDQRKDQIQFPLSVIHQNSEVQQFTQQPVGIIIAREIIPYLDAQIPLKKSKCKNDTQTYIQEFNIDLYEQLITFLCEQKQLPDDAKHPRIRNYVQFANEKISEIEQEVELDPNTSASIYSVSNTISPLIQTQRNDKKTLEQILQEFAEPMLDLAEHVVESVETRNIIITSFQFETPESSDKNISMREHYRRIWERIDNSFLNTPQPKYSHENVRNFDFANTAPIGRGVINSSAKNTVNMYTPRNDTRFSSAVIGIQNQRFILTELNGGIFSINTRQNYIDLSLKIMSFDIQRLTTYPEMTIKSRMMNIKFWKQLRGSTDRTKLQDNQLWVSNLETLKAISVDSIYASTIHSQKLHENNLAIKAKLTNCIVESSVTIKEGTFRNCIILRGCIFSGKFEFENCVFGPSCQFSGGPAKYRNQIFKFGTKIDNQGKDPEKWIDGDQI
ncbi:Translation_initiation factor [Hexamita inflata]|uniref:Translation initiation factor n=1 Tax=Hexamita inflata TaxID=28002 RepID=A0AA86NN54_9EUKA|nr:Translation initiation factor [Hexamita inflata]